MHPECPQSGNPSSPWQVLRNDDGPFPVFSSWRGPGALPSREELRIQTAEKVRHLLRDADLPDRVGWVCDNITAGLLLASMTIQTWEGEEWALELDSEDRPTAWSAPDDERAAFSWLRTSGPDGEAVIQTYQDEADFGLSFVGRSDHALPAEPVGGCRPRRDVNLVRGRMTSVQITYDTTTDGCLAPGLVTEALLRGGTGSTLLIAAEAHSRGEWHLYDESVVTLADATSADRLSWCPPRLPWRPLNTPSITHASADPPIAY